VEELAKLAAAWYWLDLPPAEMLYQYLALEQVQFSTNYRSGVGILILMCT
jgi:hypothetical protein